MFKKPNPKQNFFELEQEILRFWKNNNILEKSIDQRPIEQSKTFYDGPITANGAPHMGHALTFSMKDIIPRYWTMKGYRVSRSLGWDCQGLPVEYEIEKSLGFKEKKDIEKFGIAKFNELCRNLVLEKRDKIIQLEEMIGRLTNAEEEYATMDSKYIESIWWSIKELHNKGLLYEGFKVVPYSTRAGTTLSNAEVALGGYKAMVDPAITVEFPLEEDPMIVLLAWTTTPWTIPGNLGLAVGEKISYVKVKKTDSDKTYVVAEDLVASVFEGMEYQVTGKITVDELIGKKYIPPFQFYKNRKNAHVIYLGDHVTTESGTGIVHLAPYGAEDNEIFQKVGIESFDYLDDQGDFKSEVTPYTGINYRDANPKIIEDLKATSTLFMHKDYEHDMPMCWRTNTPLIYKPITSWYIAMSTLRNQLVENNEKINWNPKHVKQGRFGNWLAEIKDWGISRSRYWGTPLPIWKSESGKTIVIGSFEELEKLSGEKISDPHRPFIDEVIFEHEGETYRRILDVLDVWYDSGAMPFARFHYPFENSEKFEQKFPAEYIAEGIDQTRGWFYSLLAISTALFGKESYRNVLINGTIVADDGSKLSKSKKNYVDPDILIKEFSADAVRINFFSSPIASGEDAAVSQKTLKIQTQEWILPIWNIFSYLVTYANIHEWAPDEKFVRDRSQNQGTWKEVPFENVESEINSWIIFRLQETIHATTIALDNYEIQKAIKAIKELMDDISKWFIRSSRDSFAQGNESSIETLYFVFVEALKLLAPFAPFITDYIYRELVTEKFPQAKESIHLTDYPVVDREFVEQYSNMGSEMTIVRKICEMGHTVRVENQIKVRQPLSKMFVQSTNEIVPALSPWMVEMIKRELNIKDVMDVPSVVASATVKLISDENVKLTVGVETAISKELMNEGLVREIIRGIQAERKTRGFNPASKINAKIKAESPEIEEILTENISSISNATASNSTIVKGELENATKINVGESKIFVEMEELASN